MAHAWNACWVNSPRGFKSPILRHRSPVLDSKTGDFLYPLVLFLQNPTVARAAEAPHTCRKHHHDLQKSRRQPPLPPARHDPCRLGRNPAAAGTPRHPYHHPKTGAQASINVLSVTFPIQGLHVSQKRSKVLFVAYAMRRKHSWRIRLAAYGARLERVLG